MSKTSTNIDPSVQVSDKATIGQGCHMGSRTRILGPAKIGNDVWLDTNVTLYGNVTVQDSTYIGADCIIGYPRRQDLKKLIKDKSIENVVSGTSIIGKKCVIRPRSIIYVNSTLGDEVELGHNVILREGVSVGNRSLIGTNVVVDGNTIIGKGVSIQTGSYICRKSLIEDFVFLGPYCVLTNDRYVMRLEVELEGPTINNSICFGVPARVDKSVPVSWKNLLEDRYKETSNRS
jgi:UDP-3-O-[3-hydroxymyristoyl] glucosamine N-acyltransferase